MTPSSVSGFYSLRQAGFETVAQCGMMSPWQDWGWDGVPDCTRLPSMELFHWLQGLQTSVCLQPGAAATQSTPVNPYLVLGVHGCDLGTWSSQSPQIGQHSRSSTLLAACYNSRAVCSHPELLSGAQCSSRNLWECCGHFSRPCPQ